MNRNNRHLLSLFPALILAVILISMSGPTAYAALGESAVSAAEDADALSLRMVGAQPCQFEKPDLSRPDTMKPSPCIFYELQSHFPGVRVREYVSLSSPGKIFAVYWEGPGKIASILGKDVEAFRSVLKNKGNTIRNGDLLIFRNQEGNRYLVIDQSLVPKGMSFMTIGSAGN
jgi:hypothetical protein